MTPQTIKTTTRKDKGGELHRQWVLAKQERRNQALVQRRTMRPISHQPRPVRTRRDATGSSVLPRHSSHGLISITPVGAKSAVFLVMTCRP